MIIFYEIPTVLILGAVFLGIVLISAALDALISIAPILAVITIICFVIITVIEFYIEKD